MGNMAQGLQTDSSRVVVAGTGHRPQQLNPLDPSDRKYGLSQPQIKARRLKSATTKVYLIEINWQEVNHEQANKHAA